VVLDVDDLHPVQVDGDDQPLDWAGVAVLVRLGPQEGGPGRMGSFDDVGALLAAAPHSVVALGVLGVWGQRPNDVGRRLADLDVAHRSRAGVPTLLFR
jgi:hypothetical protein